MVSYEYQMFLRDKILEYLPKSFIRIGDKLNGRCPFCGDSKKSLTKKRGWVYPNQTYHCFNCGINLSGLKLIEALSGTSYDEIRREYAKLFFKNGLNASLSAYNTPSNSADLSIFNVKSIIKPEWKNSLTKDAMEYLNKRKVLDAPFLKDPLYSCFNKDKGEEYILIPWILNGVDAYYQVNDFKKFHSLKYIFPKDTHKLVYGLDNIDMSWPYIIVFEGVYDSLFVKNGIATGTKSISDMQYKLIRERYPKMSICCSFDNDVAGISSMVKMIKKNADVKFFKWFDQSTLQKDINDYVLATGDIDAFTDKSKLEKMIIEPMQMKWYLVTNGLWKEEAKPDFRSIKKKARQFNDLSC